MKLIDIHTHLAWGVDDGIQSKEDMLTVLKQAKEQGISAICLTPHITIGESSEEQLMLMKQRHKELRTLSDITICLGSEVKITSALNEQSKYYTLNNGKYVLIEGEVMKDGNDFIELMDDYLNVFLNKGEIPLIAHIERYFKGDLDVEYVRYLKEKGCILQVNSTSILNRLNDSDYENAMKLLDEQLVDVIASDVHRISGSRGLCLLECYEALNKMGFDSKYIEDMMYRNPTNILNNKALVKRKYKKRNILKRIFS